MPLPPLHQIDDPTVSFAAIRLTQPMTHIGGGYETDVFFSNEHNFAFKLKHAKDSPSALLARVRRLRKAADQFRAYLGPEHSLQNDYVLVAGPAGTSRVLAVQPFVADARSLDSLNPAGLSPEARVALAAQLATILERAFACYRDTGTLPDLYGLGPHDAAHARRWDPRWLLRTAWKMLVGRPLIDAHNLLMTADGRVVLVDYDLICHIWPLCYFVYAARALLLWRDRGQVAALARS